MFRIKRREKKRKKKSCW